MITSTQVCLRILIGPSDYHGQNVDGSCDQLLASVSYHEYKETVS
jgi:hypothetical protein